MSNKSIATIIRAPPHYLATLFNSIDLPGVLDANRGPFQSQSHTDGGTVYDTWLRRTLFAGALVLLGIAMVSG
jgi:hypothetical protein